eukprot:TRINITY_DN3201_c0_g2_i1.p1 TRINITY_DN3201_c0_g2~~TRINITY_DN3201_c0_g2_i1.p1  ORF type:complete len:143 (-),score=17.47 TRINITY_DN3201_c0_g2_i1:101-529(-)
MSLVTLSVSTNYGYVILSGIASLLYLQYLGIQVGIARKKYNVQYPKMYDDNQPVFNCIQRAHQNSLEIWPTFLVLHFLGGIRFPLLATLAGLLFVFGRVIYAQGYSTGKPENRARGSPFYGVGLLLLLGTSVGTALQFLGIA